MDSDEYFKKKKEKITSWIDTCNANPIPDISDDIEEFIPGSLTEELYTQYYMIMKGDFVKRILFDLLFMKLQNPTQKIIGFSNAILENLMNNKKYFVENSLKKVYENNKIDLKTYELRIFKFLNEEYHK